jgi:O-antigen biosynthesis protein
MTQDSRLPRCSVVVCTRDRPGQLEVCARAVLGLDYPHVELLIVDNAPSDDRARRLAEDMGVRYILEPQPGLSRARNRGARACDGDIVAFLDDDSVPEPGWLTELVGEFGDPRVMGVTGPITPMCDGRDEEEMRRLASSLRHFSPERRVVDNETPNWFELANFGGLGCGGNMAFRRELFDAWPGFHEGLGLGTALPAGEENQAFFSLIDRGHRIAYTPRAIVRHPYPVTPAEIRARQLHRLATSSAYFTFLAMEEPRYRRATVRYVAEAILGKPRLWRGGVLPPPRDFSRARSLLALLRGPVLYARSRFRR